jgi:ubiquitin-protein ligase
MSSQREKRLGKELLKIKQNPMEGCTVNLVDDKIEHWRVSFKGPKNTPFEKGKFTFDIKFPTEYPFHPPDLRCIHQVYHPNFDKEGQVCLEILRKDGWSPMIGVNEIIIALQELLKTPNVDHPLVESIAEEYVNNRSNYEKNARDWTSKYAK